MKFVADMFQFAAMGLLMGRTGFDPICIVCAVAMAVSSFYQGMQTIKEDKTT